jgi:hypothetical protein
MALTLCLSVAATPWAVADASVFDSDTESASPAYAKTQAGGNGFDLDGLIERVSETKAIGFLTKLSLKRDVDKFESDLKAYYAKKSSSKLDKLRARYNLMVNNLLVMVQKNDTKLAQDITSARDHLWAMLADPDAF